MPVTGVEKGVLGGGIPSGEWPLSAAALGAPFVGSSSRIRFSASLGGLASSHHPRFLWVWFIAEGARGKLGTGFGHVVNMEQAGWWLTNLRLPPLWKDYVIEVIFS